MEEEQKAADIVQRISIFWTEYRSRELEKKNMLCDLGMQSIGFHTTSEVLNKESPESHRHRRCLLGVLNKCRSGEVLGERKAEPEKTSGTCRAILDHFTWYYVVSYREKRKKGPDIMVFVSHFRIWIDRERRRHGRSSRLFWKDTDTARFCNGRRQIQAGHRSQASNFFKTSHLAVVVTPYSEKRSLNITDLLYSF